MTACSTDADCAGAAAPGDWCALPSSCDATYGACVVWPRCVSPPWLGCLSEAQKCVSLSGAPPPPHSEAGTVAAVILLVVGLVGTIAAYLGYRVWKRRATQ